MVCLPHGVMELPGVDLHVDGLVVLRVAQEDQVVDGHHTADAVFTQSDGQFAGESVIEFYTVALEGFHHPARTPERLADKRQRESRHTEHGLGRYLTAEAHEPLRRRIEAQLQGQGSEVAHQRAAVVAQTAAVAHQALGVETDDRMFVTHGGGNV